MLKDKILADLKNAVEGLGYETTDIVCDISKNPAFGDYSTNVSLQLSKQDNGNGKQSPQEIANKIISYLSNLSYLNKVEVAGNGFINFFVKPEVLIDSLRQLIKNPDQKSSKTQEKVIVEFTDPNPFKEFHIGHLFSNTIGESISRLLEYRGAEVKRANFYGDVGMHIAKSIWGMKRKLKEDKVDIEKIEKDSLLARLKFLGESYVVGSNAFENEKQTQDEIKEINLLIYLITGSYDQYSDKHSFSKDQSREIENLYNKGKSWTLEYFETIYEKLGTKFDYYYPESKVAKTGIDMVRKHIEDGTFIKSEGAIVFPGEEYGLHRRVFINSLGLPTYESKDLGLAIKKYEDYTYDKSIIVTGNEIKEYFQVLLMALSRTRPDIAEKTTHIAHGMVRMVGEKMSSRKGNVLTFEWLFNEVKNKVSDLMKKSDMDTKEKTQLIEIISIGAIKYSMLKSSPHMDVIFDLDKSLSMHGDSGPYLQYTYVRAKSILKNAQFENREVGSVSIEKEEKDILMKIENFESIAHEAAATLRPNVVASFVVDLAKSFNLFYQKYPIIKGDKEKVNFRLALTFSTSIILKKSLFLLGIKAPERM